MKKIFIFLSLSLGLFAAQVTMGQIAGTAHDLSGEGWGTDQICIFCHTPHNAITSVVDAPLWNHTVTTQTFVPYDSPTLDATPGQPTGSSKLCLSCHDGLTAIDSYGGATGTHFITGDANVGINLLNDHPVSFVYNTALATADGGLYDPATTPAVADLLFSGQLQCASCHDAHSDVNGYFLRMSNTASALCLTCHDK